MDANFVNYVDAKLVFKKGMCESTHIVCIHIYTPLIDGIITLIEN